MPWSEVDDKTALSLREQPGTYFILFYASGTPPWCADCRDATQTLETVFGADSSPTLNVVRVGAKEEWNTPDNVWKKSPYHAQEIPLVVKLIDGKEAGRVGEQGCKNADKLRELL